MRDIVDICVVFQEGRLYLAKALLILLLDIHLSAYHVKLVDDRLKVFGKIKVVVGSQK